MTDSQPLSDRSPPSSAKRGPPSPVLRARPPEFGAPRRDLAGCRMRTPACATIYVIDPDGYRRWIPNHMTYDRLFRDAKGIVDDFALEAIAQRPKLTTGAMLVQGDVSPFVYLLDHGVKRFIPSPAVMDKYHFSWDRIFVVKQFFIDKIPHGRSWD